MFDWMRLSKEDYVMFGKCQIFEITDMAKFFASFEVEESGIYGDNQELCEIKRIVMPTGEYSEIDILFNELWSKWLDYTISSFRSGKINYANVTRITEEHEPVGDGVLVQVSIGACAVNARDFWDYFCNDIDSGNLDFDLDTLIEYLRGTSPAPTSKTAITIREVEVLPKDFFSKTALERHDKTKKLVEILKEFINKDLSGKCTCTTKEATERIYKEKYNNDETFLKTETGRGYKKLYETVQQVLKEIEKKTGVKRIQIGAPSSKTKTSCIKHH